MIHVKGKIPALEVMPEFIDALNNTEGLSLCGGVVLYRGREPSAGVVHGPIPIRGCTLHKGASDGDVRRIHEDMKWFGPNRGLYHRGM